MSTPFFFLPSLFSSIQLIIFVSHHLSACSSHAVSHCHCVWINLGPPPARAVAVDDPSLSFAEVPCSSGHQNNNFCCPPKHLHLSYRASSLS